ncbi:MAG: YiiX/YebB-like N1pC/P60 family cysteine hydrolase [Anaeroplasmataceae bacterium]
MKRKVFIISIKVLIILLFSLIYGIFINSTVENIMIQTEIASFIKKGVYQEDISTRTEKYYKVSRETWMPDIPSFTEYNGRKYYGSSGDILLGLEASAAGIPIISEFITYNFGGHASSVCYDYNENGLYLDNSFHIESSTVYDVGVVAVKGDFWNYASYRTEVIGVRVKTSEEKKKEAFNYMVSKLGSLYNSSFIFNTKDRYYCTDLISRAYETVGIDLNYDGFYTSVLDLIASQKTYIFFYKIIRNGISYFYYLG